MKAMRILLWVGALLVASATANAQVPTSAPPAQRDSVLKAWLRRLARAELTYWRQHGTYTTDLSALGMHAKPPSMDITVVQAGGRSWWGVATAFAPGSQPSQRYKGCVIWVGTLSDFSAPPATADKTQAPTQGEPACDPS